MSALVPLIMMWMLNKSGGGSPASSSSSSAASAARRKKTKKKARKPPAWPTPASPPPMPAFQAQTPSADPGQSSTPLADLHNNPPALMPAFIQKSTLSNKAKQAAANALKKKSSSLLSNFGFGSKPAQPAATSVSVASLQQILTTRGYPLVRDGLYGPKTASAWTAAAKSKGLPPTIARVGPKIAKVVAQTYDALSVPAIP